MIELTYLDWAPHGAACHFPEGSAPRESLEVRLIILYPLDSSDVDSS